MILVTGDTGKCTNPGKIWIRVWDVDLLENWEGLTIELGRFYTNKCPDLPVANWNFLSSNAFSLIPTLAMW